MFLPGGSLALVLCSFWGVSLDRDPPEQRPPSTWTETPPWTETPLDRDPPPPGHRPPPSGQRPLPTQRPLPGQRPHRTEIPLYCKERAVRILLEYILVLKNWLPRIALIIFSLELKRFLYFWFLVPDRTFPSSYVFKKCAQQPFAFSCLRGISCWHCTYG